MKKKESEKERERVIKERKKMRKSGHLNIGGDWKMFSKVDQHYSFNG